MPAPAHAHESSVIDRQTASLVDQWGFQEITAALSRRAYKLNMEKLSTAYVKLHARFWAPTGLGK